MGSILALRICPSSGGGGGYYYDLKKLHRSGSLSDASRFFMKFEKVYRRAIMVGFGLALAVLGLVGIVSYQSATEYSRATLSVKLTYRVLNTLRNCISNLVSVESEVRGYAITSDKRYLRLFGDAEEGVKTSLDQLNAMIIDPISLEYLADLRELTTSRLNRLKLTLEAMKTGGIDEVRKVAGPGKDLMDDFRRIASLIEDRQLELLKERDDHEAKQERKNLIVIILASALAVALLGTSAFLLAQQLKRRDQLEHEVLEISEREQRRIGQDLHDGVCQQLTGIALLSRSLGSKLENSLAAEAAEIVHWVNQCIEQTRRVTRGLHPVPSDPAGLMQAIRELAENVAAMGKLKCDFICPQPVLIPDPHVATNLYRIAQEATQNALRHAAPEKIEIFLVLDDDESILLQVVDNGSGLMKNQKSTGMGLEIMAHRAQAIGGSLEVRPGSFRGTVVTCTLPLNVLK